MSIQELKITEADYASRDVASAPDRLTGTARENKHIFDRLIKELIAGRYNLLVDMLSGEGGAGNIGTMAISGVAGLSAQAMMVGLKALIDDRYTIAQADSKLGLKLDKEQAQALVKNVDIDLKTGMISVEKYDGTAHRWDTAIEKVALDVRLDGDEFVLTLADGTKQRVNLAKFIDHHNFVNGDTVSFSTSGLNNNQVISAEVRDSALTLAKFSPEVMEKFIEYAGKAESSAVVAVAAAENSESSRKASGAHAENAKISEGSAIKSEINARASEQASKDSENAARAHDNAAALSANLADVRANAARASELAAGIAAERAKAEAERASEIVGGDFAVKSEVIAAKNEAIAASDPKGSANAVKAELLPMVNLKAAIASPSFTGTPTAPTAELGSANIVQVANLEFVNNAVAAFVNGAPGALDTLNELAAALGNDPNFATTITNMLAEKAKRAVPATSGNLAKLDGNGNLVDSGKSAASFETAGSLAAHNSASDAHAGVLVRKADIFTKKEILSDTTATLLGLDPATATPDEAFVAGAGVHVDIVSPVFSPIPMKATMGTPGNAAKNGNGDIIFSLVNGDVVKYDINEDSVKIGTSPRSAAAILAESDEDGSVILCGFIYMSDGSTRYDLRAEKYNKSCVKTPLPEIPNRGNGSGVNVSGGMDTLGRMIVCEGEANDRLIYYAYDKNGVLSTLKTSAKSGYEFNASTDSNGNVITYIWKDNTTSVERYNTNGTITELASPTRHISNVHGVRNFQGGVIFFCRSSGSSYFVMHQYDLNGVLSIIDTGGRTAFSVAALEKSGNIIFSSIDRTALLDKNRIFRDLEALKGNSYQGCCAISDRKGNVVLTGGLSLVTYKSIAKINIPANCSYKFQEHDEEQNMHTTDRIVSVKAPNSGYYRFGGTLTI